MLISFVLRGALECRLDVMEAQMRRLTGTILLMGMMLSTSAIQAQTYDPRYPVCVQLATIDGTSIGCGYGTLAQCQASAAGRGAQCYANPFYAHANKKTSRRANQRLPRQSLSASK
jgi:hypothetical protein